MCMFYTRVTKSYALFCSFSAQATLEGVYEEYNKRSAYIAYLVKSQQKFQDAKLQVAAIQTSVDR